MSGSAIVDEKWTLGAHIKRIKKGEVKHVIALAPYLLYIQRFYAVYLNLASPPLTARPEESE